MLIDNYRHIHIYENCSANMLSVNFDRRDVTHFLADYKGAEASQRPSQLDKQLIWHKTVNSNILSTITLIFNKKAIQSV